MSLGQATRDVTAELKISVVTPDGKPVPGAVIYSFLPDRKIGRYFRTDAGGSVVLLADSEDIGMFTKPPVGVMMISIPPEFTAAGLIVDPVPLKIEKLEKGAREHKFTLGKAATPPAAAKKDDGNTTWWIVGTVGVLGVGGYLFWRYKQTQDGLIDEPGEPLPPPAPGMPALVSKAPKVARFRYD